MGKKFCYLSPKDVIKLSSIYVRIQYILVKSARNLKRIEMINPAL